MSRSPTWFTTMRQPMYDTSCPESRVKSTCVTAKFGSFFDHAETDKKKDKMSSVPLSYVRFLLFLQSMTCSFYHIFTVDINFVDNANVHVIKPSIFE